MGDASTTIRNTQVAPQRSVQRTILTPSGYVNQGQPVNVGKVGLTSDEVRTTTTLTGNEVQIGIQSTIQDLGFTTPVDLGSRIVDISAAEFIRSRAITFTGKAFMPGARLYPFFDDVDVTDDCKPNGGNYGDSLVCDSRGRITGTFLIPNREGKRFRTGGRIFRLTTSPTNQTYPPPASFGDAKYTATGWVDTKQSTTYSTRIYTVDNKTVSKVGNPIEQSDSVTAFVNPCPRDPIAQSFFIYDDGGCFVTHLDVFFYKRPTDPNKPQPPVILQLRALDDGGNPSNNVLPFGQVVKEAYEVVTNNVDLVQGTLTVAGNSVTGVAGFDTGPWDVNTSVSNSTGRLITENTPLTLGTTPADDFIPTRFVFPSPVYLAKNNSYCFVLISDSNEYNVWIAQSGPDVTGRDGIDNFRDAGENNQNIGTSDPIIKDPYIQGVFFKSQNGISWASDQSIDLKFAIYKAQFDTSINGEIDFVNEILPLRSLPLDPFQTVNGSNLVRVWHANHGMASGSPVSRVIFSGVSGTLNGIAQATFNQSNGHPIVSTELDYYIINVVTNATASGRVGGAAVKATENKRFQEMTLLTTPLVLPETKVSWSVTTTSSRGVNDTTTASYVIMPAANFLPNLPIKFDTSIQVSSSINEQNSSDTPPGPSNVVSAALGAKKSLQIKAVLSSTNTNISPIIDVSRFSVALTESRIDNPNGYVPSGSSVPASSVINTAFDTFQCLPTTTSPAVASTANNLFFSSSTGAIVGTTVSSGTTVTGTGTKFLSQLKKGDVIKEITTGQEKVVISIASDTVLTTDSAFSPVLAVSSLVAEPPPMKIKTKDSNTALHMSKLDVGKLLTLSGAIGDRNFTDRYVLEVNYFPNASTNDTDWTPAAPTLCEVLVAHRPVTASGTEANACTLTQKDRYVDEIAPSGGSCSSKYVSKKLTLPRVSNSLKVSFDANRHSSNQIDLYYKLDLADDPRDLDQVNWTLAEFNVDVDGQLISATPKANDSPDEFSAYEANLFDTPGFVGVQVKIVFRGGNPARVPRIKNLSIIALDE